MPRGRPGPRRPRPSYVLAISCRGQRRRVSGVTKGVQVTESPAPEARGLCGQAPALGVGEPETARTELLSEDAILFLERVNDVTRLLVDPARDGHDEELQHVGNRRQTGRAEQRFSAVTNVATRRASSVESARRTASIGFLDSTGSGSFWVGFDSCANACAGKARSRGTRCRDVIFETLFEPLWVTNPIRPRSAASRNRVMRGPGVTQGAKRSQGARRPRD